MRSGTATVEKNIPDFIAVHEDRIKRTVDVCENMRIRQKGRLNPSLHAVTRFFCNGKQLDRITKLFGKSDIIA